MIKVAILILLHCTPARAVEKIRLGVTNYNFTYLSAGAALKRGFSKAEGLDVEIIRMTPNVSVIALTNGDVLPALREAQRELGIGGK